MDEEFYNEGLNSNDIKPILFCLSMFHAVTLERRKFGTIGWNKSYKWMNSDL